MDKLTIIRESFTANPATGQVFWARRPREHFSSDGFHARHLRDKAGKPAPFGRLHRGHMVYTVRAYGKRWNVLGHRIVWALEHGTYPDLEIDHIDGNPSNNALANLRLATRSQNMHNARRARSLPRGVTEQGPGRYGAYAWDGRKLHYLGEYDCPKAAHEKWAAFVRPMRGEFFSNGVPNPFA